MTENNKHSDFLSGLGGKQSNADFYWNSGPLICQPIINQFIPNLMTPRVTHLLVLALLASVFSAQSCLSGQYQDSNNICQTCSTNCQTCQSATYCTSCQANNFLVVATGSVSCKPCSTVLLGCSICLSNLACRTCQTGFVLEANNSCSNCATRISNCSTCSTDGSTCLQCNYPYILTGNKCISSTVEKIKAGVKTFLV